MEEYRRVTRQCAADDWPGCKTHDDVLKRHGGSDLVGQFLRQEPCTWYAGDAPRERRRDVRPGQPAPSTRVIGQLKVEGFRAWVWQDDGSVYGIKRTFAGFRLHWMIRRAAERARAHAQHRR